MPSTDRMPAVFIGHGSPMNTLEHNRFTEAWQTFGASVPAPRAILAVSAHWYVNATAVTAMSRPRTIHDFYGFPDELFAFEYAAPGAPDVAEEVADAVKPRWVGLDVDSWGIDHGTWSVLAHMFPAADVPVVQLSINATKPFDYHVDLGAALAPLRDRGVLVVASGNVVHNLRRLHPGRGEVPFDWAQRFDERARDVMTGDASTAASLASDADFPMAAPTPDHFVPLLYLAGLAAAEGGRGAGVLVDGYAYGSLSMICYTVGFDGSAVAPDGGDAAPIPDPSIVPPDVTNI